MLRKISVIAFLVVSSVLNYSVSSVLAQNTGDPNTTNPNPLTDKSPEAAVTPAESAKVLYAVISSSGNLSRGLGVVSSQSFGAGMYEVIFDRSVTNCAYNATLGTTNSVGVDPTGFVTVAARNQNSHGVFIATSDSASKAASRSFHLSVSCQ